MAEAHGPNEAVCFTAGPKGAPFGAGVIHAWLAADRTHPVVAAGISTGALTAAAMQRSFQELHAAAALEPDAREAARWTWFRRYLEMISVDPLGFIWRAFPDPVDFAADQPPVQDPSCPEALKEKEADSRRHYFILTQLGVWLANLPIRISTIANLIVHWVRFKEGYGGWWKNVYWLALSGIRVAAGMLWHVVRSPYFYWETKFGGGIIPRPLLGRGVWSASLVASVAVATFAISQILSLFALPNPIPAGLVTAANVVLSIVVVVLLSLLFKRVRTPVLLALSRHIFGSLDLSKNLLSPYHLHRQLMDLFGDEELTDQPMDALLVSAALQDATQQYFHNPGSSLLTALLAAIAIPGIFPPVPDETEDKPPLKFDLIDGVAIRQNPLPALFGWLKQQQASDKPNHREKVERMEANPKPSIYVVYNVPIEPYNPKPGEGEDPIDIVEAAFASKELAKRRDTRQEVRHTNFTARLSRLFPPGSKPQGLLNISSREIAPTRDIAFDNPWAVKRDEILKVVAAGCKSTLERIYIDQIRPHGAIACSALLEEIAPARRNFVTIGAPGLCEICSECPRILEHRPGPDPEAPSPGIIRSFGIEGYRPETLPATAYLLTKRFDNLCDDHPRIAFVASGGVFRGAFHIGVIAALHTASIKPHLIVGASVGALMGGALGAISVSRREEGTRLLRTLTNVFLHVDKTVALTRSFKNAVKQIGVRSRQIKLAPSEVTRMVQAGSASDAGYASTGAPSALIDAISTMFLLPHVKTAGIAGEFVAGHFAAATNRFLTEVRAETLESLDIEYALIGVSLLQDVAKELLGPKFTGIDLNTTQPYHRKDIKVSCFATTSYLNRRMQILLGRDFLTDSRSYNFIEACLSSSAFPAVFSPRTEAQVLPGRGEASVFFADGGMFDNLPFLPAIEILQAVQCSQYSARWPKDHVPTGHDFDKIFARLANRVEKPDVFIAAGLDADAGPAPPQFDTLLKIAQRAKALEANQKIDSFQNHLEITHRTLEELVKISPDVKALILGQEREKSIASLEFLDGLVDASILKVIPADREHINGTFAFCASTGLTPERVQTSIADGCFQTLNQVAKMVGKPEFTALNCKLTFSPTPSPASGECAWFENGDGRLRCPFDAPAKGDDPSIDIKGIRAIRDICKSDKAHK